MFWATIIYDRVQIFPWAVLTLAQWGGSDLPLRFFQKVMQPPKVLKVEVDKDSRITKLTLSKAYDGSKTKQTLGTFSSRWEAGSYVWPPRQHRQQRVQGKGQREFQNAQEQQNGAGRPMNGGCGRRGLSSPTVLGLFNYL